MVTITRLPTRGTLLPEKLSDPRVDPPTYATKAGPVEPVSAKGDCDCEPAAPAPDAEWERSKRLDAYLKTRSQLITPLGPPPGDRRILAEAGIDLRKFRKRPPGVTPLGHSEMIKPLRVPFRSPQSPEVLRALWNHLSRVYALPKQITPLSAFLSPLPGLGGTSKGAAHEPAPVSPRVPSGAWAAYADAVGASVVTNALSLPVVPTAQVGTPNPAKCDCADRPTNAAKKSGGT